MEAALILSPQKWALLNSHEELRKRWICFDFFYKDTFGSCYKIYCVPRKSLSYLQMWTSLEIGSLQMILRISRYNPPILRIVLNPMTGVFIKERRGVFETQRQAKACEVEAEMGWCSHKPRNSWTGRGKEGVSPSALGGTMALPIPWALASRTERDFLLFSDTRRIVIC